MTAPLRRRNGADVKLLRARRRGRRHFGILGTLRRESLGLRPPASAFGDFVLFAASTAGKGRDTWRFARCAVTLIETSSRRASRTMTRT
jgi:hypothetical protein